MDFNGSTFGSLILQWFHIWLPDPDTSNLVSMVPHFQWFHIWVSMVPHLAPWSRHIIKPGYLDNPRMFWALQHCIQSVPVCWHSKEASNTGELPAWHHYGLANESLLPLVSVSLSLPCPSHSPCLSLCVLPSYSNANIMPCHSQHSQVHSLKGLVSVTSSELSPSHEPSFRLFMWLCPDHWSLLLFCPCY